MLFHDLAEYHKPIEQFFFSETWTWVQRLDSDIAEKVILKLLDQGITCLPIHDSFIVPRYAENILENEMNEAFQELIGVDARLVKDLSVFDGEVDQNNVLISSENLKEEALKEIISKSEYGKREYEWQKVWGPV
jgi:hypothetical protein